MWFGHVERFDSWRTLSHSLLHEPVEELAPVPREATVEAEREFVEISLEMRGCDSALMGVSEPALEQRDDKMHMGEFLERLLARGLSCFENLRTRVLFFLGKLDLSLA